MNYQVKIADVSDPATERALRELIQSANHSPALLPEKFLAKNLDSKATQKSFFLVAEEDGKIIGCNGFLANDFTCNGRQYSGYQSCWSATHPDHQGKKVFSSIINEAKRMLKEQGAGFLYGIANDNSNPIFTKKLGFTETGSQVLRMINLPFMRKHRIIPLASMNRTNACIIDEQQVMRHKLEQFPGEIKRVDHNNSWLWGKLLTKRKFGMNWKVFYVGGVQLDSEKDLQSLLKKLSDSYEPSVVQFFSCASNTFNPLLNGWKQSKMNGFIFYNLNMPEPAHLNLMIGVLDIF